MFVPVADGVQRNWTSAVLEIVHARAVRGAEMSRLDPDWPAQLRAGLRSGAGMFVEVLSPLAALSELRLVSEDAMAGRAPASTADVTSLSSDVRHALAAAGPSVTALLAPYEVQLRTELAHLPQALKDPAAARAPAVTARAAVQRLRTVDAARAAWRDLIDAYRVKRPDLDRDTRQAALAGLLVAQGLAAEAIFDVVGDLMINRGWGLMLSAHALGLPFDTDSDGHEVAIALDDRLARAEDFLVHEWGQRVRVVWLALGDASLPQRYLRLGPLQFYDSTLWPALCEGAAVPESAGDDQPHELLGEAQEDPGQDDEWEVDPFEELPEREFVLVRVLLSDAWPDRSAAFARRLVAFTIALAYPGSSWVLLPGEVSYEDGRPLSVLKEPTVPTRAGAERQAPDETGAGLPHVPIRAIEQLTAGAGNAVDLEQGALWVAAISRLPDPAQRVALGLRGLEAALPPDLDGKGWRWRGATKRFLFTPWRDGSVIGHTYSVLATLAGSMSQESRRQFAQIERGDPAVLAFALKILEPGGSDLRGALHRDQHRSALLQRLTSERATWFLELEEAFDALLSRAVRLRNSVLHGGPIAPASLASVDGFVARLGGLLNDYRVVALGRQIQPLDLLEYIRVHSPVEAVLEDRQT